MRNSGPNLILGGGSKHLFIFTGEMIQVEHLFQMGWFFPTNGACCTSFRQGFHGEIFGWNVKSTDWRVARYQLSATRWILVGFSLENLG